jgi:hypothetical protein
MQKNSDGNVVYYFSSNGDWIRKYEGSALLVSRNDSDKKNRASINLRELTLTEVEVIIKQFGFLPIKLKKVKKKKYLMFNEGYKKVDYPSKDEIRDTLINKLLK